MARDASYGITLKAMRFHASVGILPHEREHAQPIEVDLRVQLSAGKDVVDYRGLYDAAAMVIRSGHIDFLEEIADQIAERTLALSPRVQRVAISVRKPHVALGGPLAYAEVSIERVRVSA